MNQRASGMLLHQTSLSNPYPIGDLGPAATAVADFMVKSGQREVPAQAKTAVNGQYQPGGGASFFEAAREALGSLPFIADDLGATNREAGL